MGGGGGGYFSERSPAEVQQKIIESARQAMESGFNTTLSTYLSEYLSDSTRDTDLVSQRLDEIKKAIALNTIESPREIRFAGSVAKHTYVDGISDIDALLDVDGTDFEKLKPSEIRQRLAGTLNNTVGKTSSVKEVKFGQLAVTVEYTDGMQIQFLPTKLGHEQIPTRDDKWVKANPLKFKEALSKRNQECGSKLVPTIKLIKSINNTLPEPVQLSGYHIESLAIAVFKNYSGAKDIKEMLPAFYRGAKEQVMQPIKDSSGQSLHLDDYLGAASSAPRLAIRDIMTRIEKRIQHANIASSIDRWKQLLGDDE